MNFIFSWFDLCEDIISGPTFVVSVANGMTICMIIYKLSAVSTTSNGYSIIILKYSVHCICRSQLIPKMWFS